MYIHNYCLFIKNLLILLFTLQLFGDKKYLDAAIDFGEVTWNRGLLTKGYSLCHGVAGNGHVFLKLYQITKVSTHSVT